MNTATRMMKLALLADTSQFSKGLTSATKQTMTFGDRVKGIAKGIGLAFAGAATAVAGFALKLGIDGIKAASDFEETLSKVNVLFGKNAKELESWSKGAAKGFGQSQTQALDAAATFAIFGKSAGLQGKKLTSFAKNLTVLASDLASFNNTSPEEAIQAIGAALRGESEPIRKYGVLLNDASLKAEAFSQGIYSGKGNLNLSSKVLAAYGIIMQETSDAQGDFARTSGGLANSQRTLDAVWSDIQVTIGQALAPTFAKFVDWLKTDGVSGIQTFIDVLMGGSGKTLQQAALSGKKDMDGLNYAANSESQQAWIDMATAVQDAATSFGTLFAKLEIDNPDGALMKTLGMLEGFVTVMGKVADVGNIFGTASTMLSFSSITDPGSWAGKGQSVRDSFSRLFGGGKASGGHVRSGMTYLVGENGPELFTPSGGGGNITPNHRMGGINITVNALDPASAAKAVVSALNKANRMGVSAYAGAAG